MDLDKTSISSIVYHHVGYLLLRYILAAKTGSDVSLIYFIHSFPSGNDISVTKDSHVSTSIIFLLYTSGWPDCIAHAIRGLVIQASKIAVTAYGAIFATIGNVLHAVMAGIRVLITHQIACPAAETCHQTNINHIHANILSSTSAYRFAILFIRVGQSLVYDISLSWFISILSNPQDSHGTVHHLISG
ncbi:hypothetical protein M0R04_08035 [Candidatus Dojkabacteria bacterium]|nr:hypothetical protein [Candidatus Dojkabacteria bacterium]